MLNDRRKIKNKKLENKPPGASYLYELNYIGASLGDFVFFSLANIEVLINTASPWQRAHSG